jgi:hypothetical protein
MTVLFWYVWISKVALSGWSAYRVCYGSDTNPYICFFSSSYCAILVVATLFSCKGIPKPKQLDSLEGEYLRRLEEGMINSNDKQD